MEAPDTEARFVEDLLDFSSDLGEEDDDADKPRKAFPPFDPHGLLGPTSFSLLNPDEPGLSYPVSCFGCVVRIFFLRGDEFPSDSAESRRNMSIRFILGLGSGTS